MRTLIALGIASLLIYPMLLFDTRLSGAVDDDSVLPVVNWSDIPKKVKLVGRLGVTLGEEAVTIRGTWRANPDAVKPYDDPTKTSAFSFVVTSVNGKLIQAPVEIPWSFIEPLRPRGRVEVVSDSERKWIAESWRTKECAPRAFDGDEWEMMGFEAGHTVGYPHKISRMYIEQNPYGPGTFVTVFRIVTARTFGKPHVQSEVGGYTLVKDEAPEDVEEKR